MVEAICGAGSVAQALARPSRLRRAVRWANAASARTGSAGAFRTTLATLANRGRFMALSGAPALASPEVFRALVRVDGRAHLDAIGRRGAILLGFHVLPGVAALALAVSGVRFVATGEEGAFRAWTRASLPWQSALDAWRDRVVWSDPASRVRGLARLRDRLKSGGLVHLTADGPAGRELFRIGLPVGALVVRSGWWTLRRLTGAPALPILAHREGRRVVVRIMPALSAPLDDPAEDLRVCQATLASLVADHVRRFADQSASLVTWDD
jgi:hypothetical protein